MSLSDEQLAALRISYYKGQDSEIVNRLIDTIESLRRERDEAVALAVAGAYLAASKLAEVQCMQLPSQVNVTREGAVSRAILALTPADAQAALAARDAELKRIIERDRTLVAECITAVQKELKNYNWLTESRGSYEWDDDRWHDEFKRAHDSILNAIEPMVKLAGDLSNSPTKWEEVLKARDAEKDATIARLQEELADKDALIEDLKFMRTEQNGVITRLQTVLNYICPKCAGRPEILRATGAIDAAEGGQ